MASSVIKAAPPAGEAQSLMAEAELARLKEHVVALTLLRSGAEPFTLASGRQSTFIFNVKNLFGEPEPATLVTRRLYDVLEPLPFDCIAGVELGAVFPVTAVVLHSHARARPVQGFVIRKKPKGHGTKNRIEGLKEVPSGATVVIIEDVTTTGGSLLEAVEAVREAGMTVRQAVTIIDRGEGAAEHLRANGIELIPVFTRRDFLPDDVV